MTGMPLTGPLLVAADRLWDAATDSLPCAPVRDVVTSGVDAYRVQQHNLERLQRERGWRICGRKIGLTSLAVQAQLGVDQPDFGAIIAELGHGDGEEVPIEELMQPRIEAEVGVVLEHDLDKSAHTVVDVLAATAFVLPVLEIVDSRIAGWDITFVDTVADNASAGRFVVGTVPSAIEIDLATVTMTMTVNGEQRSEGRGAACLGHPLFAVRWLADTMVAMGSPLRAGDLVLSGALGPMVPIRAGDVIEAEIVGVGRVGTRVSASTMAPQP